MKKNQMEIMPSNLKSMIIEHHTKANKDPKLTTTTASVESLKDSQILIRR